MATLTINGRSVTVDDSFKSLPPDQQEATVNEIARSIGVSSAEAVDPVDPDAKARPPEPAMPKDDKYRQAAREEIANLKAIGAPVGGRDYVRQFLQGGTFNFLDEALAAVHTPMEMYKRGTLDPREGYNYSKAYQNQLTDEARKEGGIPGMAAEFLGGGGAASVATAAGLTATKAGQAIGPRIAALLKDGAVYGALSGAGDAEGWDRFTEGVKGGALGGAAGATLGAAAPLAGAVGRNTLGWLSAVNNPEGYASKQLARALSESGQNPAQIASEIASARAAGQPYTLADALGNPGQRMLSVVSRNPGEGRTAAVEFLENRQGGQGRRMANILAEGLDAPQTRRQAEASMRATRSADATANYDAARNAAGAVDVSPALNIIDRTLQPGATSVMRPQTNIADDSIEAAVRKAQSYLTDGKSVVSDFNAALRSKQELDAMIEGAKPTVQRMLIPIRNALDDSLAMASKPYAAARDQFRQQSKAIDALDTGRNAAMRGRAEDTTRTFAGLSQPEQGAFRVGYADPLIEQVQGGAFGVNKARPFTSDAMQAELQAIGVNPQDTLARIARENRMFETRAQAMGGSKTADNLADNAAMGVSPEVLAQVARGRPGAALGSLAARSVDTLSGNTPEVRKKLAELLLSGDASGLQRTLQTVVTTDAERKKLLTSVLAGMVGGGVGPANQSTAISR